MNSTATNLAKNEGFALKPKPLPLDKTLAFKFRGLFGVLILGPAFLIVLFSQPAIHEGTWINLALDTLGWVLFYGGVAFRVWATLYVGARKLKTLVDQGPYSITRNPLYVGSLLMALGSAIFLKSVVFAAAVLFVMVVYTMAMVPTEERALHRQHLENYDAYRSRVPRYIPRPSLFTTPDMIEVKIAGVRLEAKRLALWIWVPLLCAVVQHMRMQPNWPHWFHSI
ncbi:MAG: methyltransferase family protein [Verrucomicrobiota bacterium]